MGARPLCRSLADRSGRSTSRAIAERSAQEGQTIKVGTTAGTIVRDCLEDVDASAINPYFAFMALCVALYVRLCPFPKCPTYFAIFFLLVIFEGYSFAFLVMMITMFVSPFPGMSLIVFFQIVAFDCLMLIWASQVVAPCPSDLWGLLSFAYGVLIDTVYALIYHIPWWTHALVNGFSLTLPMLCRRSFSIPLSNKSLGDFMLKKSFWWPICSSSLASGRLIKQ